jgi:hypothetical protein
LEIHIRHALGPMMDEQFGDLIVVGAKTRQGLVLAAHPAVEAVLTAIVGKFDHSPDEDMPSKLFNRHGACPSMQALLLFSPPIQPLRANSAIPVHLRSVKGFRSHSANEIVGKPVLELRSTSLDQSYYKPSTVNIG